MCWSTICPISGRPGSGNEVAESVGRIVGIKSIRSWRSCCLWEEPTWPRDSTMPRNPWLPWNRQRCCCNQGSWSARTQNSSTWYRQSVQISWPRTTRSRRSQRRNRWSLVRDAPRRDPCIRYRLGSHVIVGSMRAELKMELKKEEMSWRWSVRPWRSVSSGKIKLINSGKPKSKDGKSKGIKMPVVYMLLMFTWISNMQQRW